MQDLLTDGIGSFDIAQTNEDPRLEHVAVRSVEVQFQNEDLLFKLISTKNKSEDVNRTEQTKNISTNDIRRSDALRGRGGDINAHIGNIIYRQLCLRYEDEYRDLSRTRDKQDLALAIIWCWRSYGGRYLEPQEEDDEGNVIFWRDIGDYAMRMITQQLLRN